MSLAVLLTTIIRLLEDAGIPHMLTGSLAAAYYASPRATQDVDLVVRAHDAQIRTLVQDLLNAGLYVSEEAASEAFRTGGQFNAIDPDTGWKVDFIVRKDRPFSIAEFERRTPAVILGVDIALTTLEDLVIAKLEWSVLGDSELQRRDVAQLLEAGDSLDRDYVEGWVRDLGLTDAWRSVLDRLKPS